MYSKWMSSLCQIEGEAYSLEYNLELNSNEKVKQFINKQTKSCGGNQTGDRMTTRRSLGMGK